MEEIKTWRDLLGQIASDSHEKQRIAEAVGINPITLTRWINNKSNPRQDNLRPLLDALPPHRQQLTDLIAKEFPDFFNGRVYQGKGQDIPSAFYAQVLNAYANSPHQLRTSTVSLLIVQQILNHLDPRQQGLLVQVAQCMTPGEDQKVRSLRRTVGRGTALWRHMDHVTQFYGAEAQAGNALIARHPTIIQKQQDGSRLFPIHRLAEEESSAVYPILLADRTAGSLYVISTQQDHFTPFYQELLLGYTELLVLAFEQKEFYDLAGVELGVMPEREKQQAVLASFQSRVTRKMVRAAQNNQQLTRPEAEVIVWQEMEQELFYLP